MDFAFMMPACRGDLGRKRPERGDGDDSLKPARRQGDIRAKRNPRARLELLTGMSDSSGVSLIMSRVAI